MKNEISKMPKRSWVKRHKKLIIVSSIIFVLIAPIIGYIWFTSAWNAGMGLPEGYRFGRPITEETRHNILKNQFIEDNPEGCPEDRIYFRHKEEKYRMQSNAGKINNTTLGYSVYKEADDTKIGDFIKQEDFIKREEESPEKWAYGSIEFYDDHYIYYEFVQWIRRYYFEFSFQGTVNERSYTRYTFYRLDLDTGSNEEVKIKLFVEKLNKYDETVKIK